MQGPSGSVPSGGGDGGPEVMVPEGIQGEESEREKAGRRGVPDCTGSVGPG